MSAKRSFHVTTPAEVRLAIIAAGVTTIDTRECSICGTKLFYLFDQNAIKNTEDEGVYYSTDCDCVSYRTPPQSRTWEDIANSINMQMTNESYNSARKSFFLDPI